MNNIGNNSRVFLFCGIALAGVTGFGLFSALDKTENLVPQVVATQTIEPRTQITERMVQIKNVPALGRNESALDDTSLVIGGYSTTKIFADQPIIQPMVAKQFDETGASGMALSIPDENLRAISLAVAPADVVGGKISKGDFVDIVATFDEGKLHTESGITKTLIQNVDVFDYSKEDGYITLLLPLDRIETIMHAQHVGKLVFVLNPGNPQRAKTVGMINTTLCERFNFSCKPAK